MSWLVEWCYSFARISVSPMSNGENVSEILLNWDTDNENKKAKFIELLYQFYCRDNGLYTGLWETFKNDLAKFGQFAVTEGLANIEDLFIVD